MALKFRRGTTAQKSGSLAFGEPYVNTDLNTLMVGGASGDITLAATFTTSSNLSVNDITASGNISVAGNVTVAGQLQIGDQTSDTVNVVASLSSSLIPQTTNAFDLGSATKIWRDLYISTGSIKFTDANGTVINTFNNNTLTNLLNNTGSQQTQNTNLATITGSLILTASSLESRLGTIGSYTSSLETRMTAIATITGSLIVSESNSTIAIANLNNKTGSYATTGSNTFTGNQIISGAVYITSDLVVYGSSSIQNVSASAVNIGTNIINLNTANPAVRFAGISVQDSGSNAGVTGSLLWDSTNNGWIYSRESGSSYRGGALISGPRNTTGILGNEQTTTANVIQKGQGGDHITGSNIYDDGTTISMGSNVQVTGSLLTTGNIQTTTGYVQTNLLYNGGAIEIRSNYSPLLLNPNGAGAIIYDNTQISGSLIVSGSITGSTNFNTIVNKPTLVSGSSQITLSSTTGFGTYINQAVLTSSSPTFAGLTINGAITATGDITAYYSSDRRFKSNIQLIPNALEKVTKLNGVTWTWNDDVNEVTKTTPNTGLIAQEVQEVLPEVVMEREDGHLGLDYSKMVGLLVEAIKEQQTQIHSLTIEIENLKKQKGL